MRKIQPAQARERLDIHEVRIRYFGISQIHATKFTGKIITQ